MNPLSRRTSNQTILKVCGVSHADLLSSRFNGLNSIEQFSQQKIEYKLLSDVHQRKSGKSLTPFCLKKLAQNIKSLETRTGFQSRLYFWTIGISLRRDFRKANVVHYHILHNDFFRIESLKLLMRIKPSLWTLHDLWITTGHCIQPLGCKQYGNGCGACPHLGRTIPVKRDRTQHEFRRKVNLVRKLNCDFIVSTNWMKVRVLQNLPINPEMLNVIPFGVDTESFYPILSKDRNKLREKNSIDPMTFVILINAHNDEIKGIEIVKRLIPIAKNLANILFVLIDGAQIFLSHENVLSFPRATSEKEMFDLFSLVDLVVVPSLGESFSLLTLEAMSCGKAVVTLENSAAHEVTESSSFFTFNEQNAVKDLLSIIEKTSHDPVMVRVEGERNRNRVLTKFSIETHVMELSKLYRRIGDRH